MVWRKKMNMTQRDKEIVIHDSETEVEREIFSILYLYIQRERGRGRGRQKERDGELKNWMVIYGLAEIYFYVQYKKLLFLKENVNTKIFSVQIYYTLLQIKWKFLQIRNEMDIQSIDFTFIFSN